MAAAAAANALYPLELSTAEKFMLDGPNLRFRPDLVQKAVIRGDPELCGNRGLD